MNHHLARFVPLGVFLATIALSGPSAAAPLLNGDFSAGFAGWDGEVTDIFFTTTTVSPPPGAFVGNFDASSGAAVLTTTTLIDDVFAVFIFQTFDLPAIGAGESLQLSYDLAVALTNPIFGDAAFAQLNHGAGFGVTIDLLSGSSVDITSLAGETVELLFGVEDFDDLSDNLSVDNIAVNVLAAQVPEPGTLALVALALAGFGAQRARRK